MKHEIFLILICHPARELQVIEIPIDVMPSSVGFVKLSCRSNELREV